MATGNQVSSVNASTFNSIFLCVFVVNVYVYKNNPNCLILVKITNF